jgi:hypothetical protein
VDANFKLKRKERGLKDIELMPGWAYFVEETKFQEHVANYVDQPEVRSCFLFVTYCTELRRDIDQ